MPSDLAAWYAGVQRFNPNRVPKGQAGGGQFAPASGGSGAAAKGKTRPTPGNKNPVGMGEHSQRVHDLQERLNALGFKPPLKVDGTFGPKTLAAVRNFQKQHGLKVDGLVGPKTTAALRAKPAVHKAAAGHKTATVKPAGGKTAAKTAAKTATVKRADTWAAQWAGAWTAR